MACRNRFIILTLFFFFFFFFFFFKWKIAVRKFCFSPYSWLIHIALIGKCEFKKKYEEENFPAFFCLFHDSTWCCQIHGKISIVLKSENNHHHLRRWTQPLLSKWWWLFSNDVMTIEFLWLAEFSPSTIFFFLKRNNWKQFTSKRWKSMAFWVWITIHLHHCVEYLKKKTNLHFHFILVYNVYIFCVHFCCLVRYSILSAPPFDFCIGNFSRYGPFVTFHVTVVSWYSVGR